MNKHNKGNYNKLIRKTKRKIGLYFLRLNETLFYNRNNFLISSLIFEDLTTYLNFLLLKSEEDLFEITLEIKKIIDKYSNAKYRHTLNLNYIYDNIVLICKIAVYEESLNLDKLKDVFNNKQDQQFNYLLLKYKHKNHKPKISNLKESNDMIYKNDELNKHNKYEFITLNDTCVFNLKDVFNFNYDLMNENDIANILLYKTEVRYLLFSMLNEKRENNVNFYKNIQKILSL